MPQLNRGKGMQSSHLLLYSAFLLLCMPLSSPQPSHAPYAFYSLHWSNPKIHKFPVDLPHKGSPLRQQSWSARSSEIQCKRLRLMFCAVWSHRDLPLRQVISSTPNGTSVKPGLFIKHIYLQLLALVPFNNGIWVLAEKTCSLMNAKFKNASKLPTLFKANC